MTEIPEARLILLDEIPQSIDGGFNAAGNGADLRTTERGYLRVTESGADVLNVEG